MKYSLMVVVCISLLASACSRNRPAGTPQDACTLVPKEIVESTLDVKLLDPKLQDFGQNPRQQEFSYCQYVAKAQQPVYTLNITVKTGGVPSTPMSPAENFIVTMKQSFGQRYELKKLPTMGDGGVWDGSLKQLTIFKGSTTYALTAPGATIPDLEQRMIALAEKTVLKDS